MRGLKWIPVFGLVVLLANFCFFRWSNNQIQKKAKISIQSLLKNELLIANTYALSKSIYDLESLGIIRCSEIFEGSDKKRDPFYSTLKQGSCYHSPVLRSLSEVSFVARSVSGQSYFITLQMSLSWQAYTLEFLIYVLIILGSLFLRSYLKKQGELDQIREKALLLEQEEKKLFLDHAKQIRHDVQSPLQTLKSILRMLNEMDPTLKSVFERSVQRTEQLFNQLNAATDFNQTQACSILDILSEMVTEKSMAWRELGVEIIFSSTVAKGESLSLVNALEFKRLISNLLNNSAEACLDHPIKRVEVLLTSQNKALVISIIDSGKGMPQEVIEKLGQKGFTRGKEGHQTAGSGLGVYHAISTLKNWGGHIEFQSQENLGTTVIITLPSVT